MLKDGRALEKRGGRREEGRERDGLGMGIGGYRDMTMKKKNIMCH